MSDRDCVGHPDFDPKGTRNNLHSQHKGAGRLQAQSATGRDSKNSQQQENLRDCRTQVLSPRPLGPAKLSIEAKQKAQRETEREREREREKEREGFERERDVDMPLGLSVRDSPAEKGAYTSTYAKIVATRRLSL